MSQNSVRAFNGENGQPKTRSTESVPRSGAQMTYRGRSSEELSYAAAVVDRKNSYSKLVSKGSGDFLPSDFATTLDGSFIPVTGKQVPSAGIPTAGKGNLAAKLNQTTKVSKRDFGVQVSIDNVVHKSISMESCESQTDLNEPQRKDQSVSAKLCCNETANSVVEFCGDQFKLETTLARSLVNLNICFFDRNAAEFELNGITNI